MRLVLTRNADQLRDDVVANVLCGIEDSATELGLGVVTEGERRKPSRREHGVNLHHREVDHLLNVSIE